MGEDQPGEGPRQGRVLEADQLEDRLGVDKGVSPADASATKVFGTELATEAYRLLMECVGDDATLTGESTGSIVRGRLERAYRGALILTFGGGTNEIQRDIIAMVALGLPRSPR